MEGDARVGQFGCLADQLQLRVRVVKGSSYHEGRNEADVSDDVSRGNSFGFERKAYSGVVAESPCLRRFDENATRKERETDCNHKNELTRTTSRDPSCRPLLERRTLEKSYEQQRK